MKEENRKNERRALLVTSMDPLRRESALTKNAIFLRKFVLSPSPQKKKLEPAYPVTFPLCKNMPFFENFSTYVSRKEN